jgi:hypothetical protein
MDMVLKDCTLIKGEKVDGWLYKNDSGSYCIVDEKTGMSMVTYVVYKRKDVVAQFTDIEHQNALEHVISTEHYARQVELVNKRKTELGIEF